MADLSLQTVLGIKLETVPGTYVGPTNSDLITVADLKPTIEGLTADIREYTGSIHRPGPVVLGKTMSVSGKLLLRGPGGSNPPAADTWIPGRILRAAGFSEAVTATAVPVAPEAVGSGGDTTTVVLGTTASTTDDIYQGLLLLISALGANRAALSPVRDYIGSTKAALLAETAGAPLTSGNWQLPKQLTYLLSTGAAPTLSVSCWIGSRRYNGRGMAISAFKINLPTSSRESQDVPSIEFTLTGDVHTVVDEAAPTPPTGLAVPPFRDGKLWVANKQLGGSSLTVDLGAQVGYAPNPNYKTGNEAAQLTETTRKVDITLNQVALSVFDDVALADAQAYHSLFGLWGLGSGNAFGLLVSDMRFAPRSPDNSGAFVTQTGEAYIDGASRTIALSIPFGVPF